MVPEVHLIPCSDNYIYLIQLSKSSIVVDPAQAAPVRRELSERGLDLACIVNTHHHVDHTGGNEELRKEYGCPVVAPDDDRIPHIDRRVYDREQFILEGLGVEVIGTPGHTLSHVTYYIAEQGWLFAGDTLFAGGCGRLFEGSAEQMWLSLCALRELPEETKIYCGHEYTESNLEFALSVDPNNQRLLTRLKRVRKVRAQGEPSIPSTIYEEKQTNPFLRCDDSTFQDAVGMKGVSPAEVFAEVRNRKDRF